MSVFCGKSRSKGNFRFKKGFLGGVGMLLSEELDVQMRGSRSMLVFSRSQSIKLGSRRLDRKRSGGARNGGTEGDCRICAAAGDLWVKLARGEGSEFVGQIGGFSHESEHDLAVMVSDFLENGSGGAESRYSSDSDSGFPDPNLLAEKILFHKNPIDLSESALSASVKSLLLTISDADLISSRGSQCNGSCIRQRLAKLLQLSGYDSAVCASKWQSFGKLPGGDHEYVDVILSEKTGTFSDRQIIDIDFQSHFQIARAVESYDAILNSLPVIYVGSMAKLKQFLQIMVEAAKFSLNQNSMPLPPWRSLPYLQAKWQSGRKCCPDEPTNLPFNASDHKQCIELLKRLKSSILLD